MRIIAATNGDIRGAVKEGRLREDLYHRLAHIEVEMPPLRARRQDIPVLAERFLKRTGRPLHLSLEVRRLLVAPSLQWSGNIRQLERVVLRARERAVARDPEATELRAEHFDQRDLGVEAEIPVPTSTNEANPVAARWQELQSRRTRLETDEKDVLRAALLAAKGNISQAARELGIARTTLASRLDAVGLRGSKGEA